jgi:tagatose-6-phosphate ketose/aldose isomerase
LTAAAYPGLSEPYLLAHGADRTAREIAQQPQAWQETQALLTAQREKIQAFLVPLLAIDELRIILTGAGSSAYIGQCLAPELLRTLGKRVEAIATTDLVSGPRDYLQSGVPTLLVSFARSGGSPESLAAVELADQCLEHCHHLIITCNAEGALYRHSLAVPGRLAVLLPAITHDLGFAMTSSFSSMLYAALAIFRGIDRYAHRIERLASAAAALIERHSQPLKALAERDFARVVFLGSRGFAGLAAEAALKLLELTDGAVVSVAHTPLGFRHGPKTIVNRATLVLVFVSNDPLARKYEMDLLQELHTDAAAGGLLAIAAQGSATAQPVDWLLVPELSAADDVDLILPFVVLAQVYALHRSLQLGNTPDTPCASGRVSRIVKGVAIYPL